MSPPVSVALCCLNGGRFVRAQLDSILNQTRPPDEIIIADDASEDDTLAIIADMSRRAPGVIRLLQNPVRLGVTRNFEQAITQAAGDIIFLSDQDDVWLPERVSTMLRPFEKDQGVSLVFSDAAMVTSELEPLESSFFAYLGLARYRQPTAAQVVKAEAEVAGCLIAFRSRLKPLVLPLVKGWVYDHQLAFIAHAVSRVVRIDERLMLHRRHGDNTSSDAFFRRGFRHQLQAARQAAGPEVYAHDRRQWEAMLERLQTIAAEHGAAAGSHLEEYIRECERRLTLAKERESWRRMSRARRAGPALGCLLRGHYHRYLRGFRTFGKDCWL